MIRDILRNRSKIFAYFASKRIIEKSPKYENNTKAIEQKQLRTNLLVPRKTTNYSSLDIEDVCLFAKQNQTEKKIKTKFGQSTLVDEQREREREKLSVGFEIYFIHSQLISSNTKTNDFKYFLFITNLFQLRYSSLICFSLLHFIFLFNFQSLLSFLSINLSIAFSLTPSNF